MRRLHLRQHPGDVDASVRRRVGPEPPLRLLELPPAPVLVPPPGLVPRDDDVDEALVEVPLLRGGGAPRELQLLVRLEVRTPARKRKSFLEPGHRVQGSATLAREMATILLAGVDLFFRGKLEVLLSDHHLIPTDGVDPPDLVICDIARIDAQEVADMYPDAPIIGYTNHTDTAGLRAAHAAGFDQVVVKSALVERAPELVDQLLG